MSPSWIVYAKNEKWNRNRTLEKKRIELSKNVELSRKENNKINAICVNGVLKNNVTLKLLKLLRSHAHIQIEIVSLSVFVFVCVCVRISMRWACTCCFSRFQPSFSFITLCTYLLYFVPILFGCAIPFIAIQIYFRLDPLIYLSAYMILCICLL